MNTLEQNYLMVSTRLPKSFMCFVNTIMSSFQLYGVSLEKIQEDGEVYQLICNPSDEHEKFLSSQLSLCCPCYSHNTLSTLPKFFLYSSVVEHAGHEAQQVFLHNKDALLLKFLINDGSYITVTCHLQKGLLAMQLCQSFAFIKDVQSLILMVDKYHLWQRIQPITECVKPYQINAETPVGLIKSHLGKLTQKEQLIAKSIAKYKFASNTKIADYLNISKRTVDKHLENIYLKLNIHHRIDLINQVKVIENYYELV
ncbi:helix-turn-helix domain-containing protein [Facilibium subflavum]|uniref:helix-turn-helix domain-containing protein n=1 Tax=Facilibium subflavum TaxID=2219058 RepID=UPI0013C36B07|nr:helix-turn-helix transcriptional regulator [Facilibium subflavum]